MSRPPLTDMAVDECFPPPIQTHVLTLPRWQSRAALALLSLIAALVGWCAVELRANRAEIETLRTTYRESR